MKAQTTVSLTERERGWRQEGKGPLTTLAAKFMQRKGVWPEMTGEDGSRSQDSGASWGWAAQKGRENFSFGMKRKKEKMNIDTEQMDGTQGVCRGAHPYSAPLESWPPTAACVTSTETYSDHTSPCLKPLGDFLTHLSKTKTLDSGQGLPGLAPPKSHSLHPKASTLITIFQSLGEPGLPRVSGAMPQTSPALTLDPHPSIRSQLPRHLLWEALHWKASHTRPGSLGSSPVHPRY